MMVATHSARRAEMQRGCQNHAHALLHYGAYGRDEHERGARSRNVFVVRELLVMCAGRSQVRVVCRRLQRSTRTTTRDTRHIK
jgi:hypothetical protein